jgi:hypothetical protein
MAKLKIAKLAKKTTRSELLAINPPISISLTYMLSNVYVATTRPPRRTVVIDDIMLEAEK